MAASSRFPGFYRLGVAERRARLARAASLDPADIAAFDPGALGVEGADLMVENAVGTFELPLGIGLNMRVDGRDVLVPMVVEEPSVVAAASHMAKLVREAGGFHTEADRSVMIGQVQVWGLDDPEAARRRLEAALDELATLARRVHPALERHGGGLRGMSVRAVRYDEPGQAVEDMLVLHFYLDCADAMGANMVNTVAERLAGPVERITGGRVGLRILSNLASRRMARARCAIPYALLDAGEVPGREVAEGIARAYRFAWADPWRAATHNKGVMNGIDAVALATGNDWRAIEAGAHAWAARDGRYRTLTRWVCEDGALHGSIEVPMQVGTVGGATRRHPTVRTNLKLLGDPDARTLAGIMAAVGLTQNLAALRALVTEGIQRGHMRLHARRVAAEAGARPDEVEAVVARMAEADDWSADAARAALAALRSAG